MDPSMQMGSAPPLSYKLYETDVILLTQHNPLLARFRDGPRLKGSARQAIRRSGHASPPASCTAAAYRSMCGVFRRSDPSFFRKHR
jgi:hypothetical protein